MISLDSFKRALGHAENWKGCDWVTQFGPRNLNLCGLRSRQAALAGKATRGEEARAWKEAAQWLAELERDADRAAECSHAAIHALNSGDNESAMKWLQEAERLEQHYRVPSQYGAVRATLERSVIQPTLPAGDEEALAGVLGS